MQTFVALLRAINVGGTGKLPMAELVRICEGLRFSSVKTYIQSGNVVFGSRAAEAKVKASLEKALEKALGKPVGVILRRPEELERVLASNPFGDAPPSKVIVLFLDTAPPASAIAGIEAPGGEQLALRGRELFVHYPEGQGKSKLKVPLFREGTGRNLNTVLKLAQMSRAIESPASSRR